VRRPGFPVGLRRGALTRPGFGGSKRRSGRFFIEIENRGGKLLFCRVITFRINEDGGPAIVLRQLCADVPAGRDERTPALLST
jgi:hypothetical protein